MPRRCSAVNIPMPCPTRAIGRSEEHTSELQSQSNLVCRLLLEKKKKHTHRCPQAPLRHRCGALSARPPQDSHPPCPRLYHHHPVPRHTSANASDLRRTVAPQHI